MVSNAKQLGFLRWSRSLVHFKGKLFLELISLAGVLLRRAIREINDLAATIKKRKVSER